MCATQSLAARGGSAPQVPSSSWSGPSASGVGPASPLLASPSLSVGCVRGGMHGPQPSQSALDAPLPWDRGKYGLADALALAPLYSDTPPPWDRGKHLVWSTHPLGTSAFLFFSLTYGFLRLLSPSFLRACHCLLFPTMGAAWVPTLTLVATVSQVRAGGNGSRQISLRPEWSNRCDWSGIQLSIRFFPCVILTASPLEQNRILGDTDLGEVVEAAPPTSDGSMCDPLRVALGTEQNLGRH